ncbi:MAG: 3-deoxy-manno-octulosonate cytidylyltransferase [Candidatus Hydrogenedentes bacterium]|nr:3-deoxy-manno-octulosonate cytidylyltransferase [Candidatus Hydrogenedentota bacterium]
MAAAVTPKILAVIPARFASTRFPGKVIAPIAGKPLVAHVYERCRNCALLTETVVATDDPRVVEALTPFNVMVAMTRSDHPSGTDRIAEVAARSDAAIVVNVQGDEPLIDPLTIDATVRALLSDADVPMATAKRQITELERIADPNVVKVVCDERGRALYFSRFPIPYVRDHGDRGKARYWQHIGIYAFRRDFLLKYAKMPATPLEKLEKLEQLRVLENGYPIAVVETEYLSIGVDSPEDLERVRAMVEGALKGKK